jgi:hypothetical protein
MRKTLIPAISGALIARNILRRRLKAVIFITAGQRPAESDALLPQAAGIAVIKIQPFRAYQAINTIII